MAQIEYKRLGASFRLEELWHGELLPLSFQALFFKRKSASLIAVFKSLHD